MLRCWFVLLVLLMLGAGAVRPVRAQPGSSGGSVGFRVFMPAGQLVTPTTASYEVGYGDAPGSYFAGLHRISKLGRSARADEADCYYDSTGFYYVTPPRGHFGAPVSDAFRLYIARGQDTMFVYPPSIQRENSWLDSIPFQPGTYQLSKFVYDAAAFVKPLGLRVSPGPLTDWQALRKPVPVMYLEQVADLGNDAFRNWQRRRSSWDTVLVKNGQRCKTWMMAKQPYPDGLQRISAGPPAYYYSWLSDRRCLFLLGSPQSAASEPLKLFEIREPIDSAYFFPRGKEFKERTTNRWDPPRFLLDTVFYEQGPGMPW